MRKIRAHDCNSTDTGAATVSQNPELSYFSPARTPGTKILRMVPIEPFKPDTVSTRARLKQWCASIANDMNDISKTGHY